MEISIVSVGAAFLVVLLFMVLNWISGQKHKDVQENHKGSKSS